VPSQQPQGQLQTQHSTDIHNYIMDTHNIKSRIIVIIIIIIIIIMQFIIIGIII
jgi:hypothetical protein